MGTRGGGGGEVDASLVKQKVKKGKAVKFGTGIDN